jgi:hypothetical protein
MTVLSEFLIKLAPYKFSLQQAHSATLKLHSDKQYQRKFDIKRPSDLNLLQIKTLGKGLGSFKHQDLTRKSTASIARENTRGF